jgi:TonB family protein
MGDGVAAPLGIAEHNGTLWVCGWDEMIAESTDSGRDWTVRNLQPKGGELLFSFAFFGQGKMAVFGSAGVWYSSADGGSTWKRQLYAPAYGLTQVAFADAKDGYGINGNDIAWTHNGGRSWRFARSASSPIAVAALGPKQAAVLAGAGMAFRAKKGRLTASARSQSVLSTTDGGKHWGASKFPPAWEWAGLEAGAGQYELYGALAQGKGRTPTAADSADGGGWRKSAAPPAFPAQCNPQGCLLNDSAWAAWPRFSPAWAVPDDAEAPLALGWAAAGTTVCRIGGNLRCRSGRVGWSAPPTKPAGAGKSLGNPTPAMCVHCPSPKYPESARWAGQQGVVLLAAEISAKGRIDALLLHAAPSAALARAALAAVKTWRYHPLVLGGKKLPVYTEITVNFTLGR